MNKFAGSPYNESWRDYVNYLRRFEWTRKGGIEPNEWGQRIKPFAVNEMTMLAYYAEIHYSYLRYLPVLPYYADYHWRKPFCDLNTFQPGGKFTGNGLFLSIDQYYHDLVMDSGSTSSGSESSVSGSNSGSSSGRSGVVHDLPLASIMSPAEVFAIPIEVILPPTASSSSSKSKSNEKGNIPVSLTNLATAANVKVNQIVKTLSQYFFPTSSSSTTTTTTTDSINRLNTTITTTISVHLIIQRTAKESVSYRMNLSTIEQALQWQPDLQVYRQPLSMEEETESLASSGSIKVVLLVDRSRSDSPTLTVLSWPLALAPSTVSVATSTLSSSSSIVAKVNPISIFSTFDPGSYGQSLGGTHKKRGRDKGFLDTSHIVGQSRLLSNCIPEMLCMNVSRPTRTQRLSNLVGSGSGSMDVNSGSSSNINSGSSLLVASSASVNHCFTAPFVRCGIDLQYTPLINLHIHSKNADRFVSMPCPCP